MQLANSTRPQETCDALEGFIGVLEQLTFPYHDSGPSHSFQGA